ncbi:MAG: VWA domain-containing protein [Spirochaetales bacterium]|nr:VWA domain-containing protein [Spirochaetales bacterium]
MTFQSPSAFLLLLLIPLLIYLKFRSSGRGYAFPSFEILSREKKTWREKLVYLPEIFLILAFLFFVTALARPQKGFSQVRQVTNGIAVEIVIDRSSSMSAPVNNSQNRLDVVKELFKQFVQSRPDDMIGLISFARYADTNAPLTLAHDVLPLFMDGIDLVQVESEDGTAIGDALALAAARLHTAEEEEGYQIKSRVVVLLTDGVNNVGRLSPEEAADLAAEWGIKVYTIGFSQSSLVGQLFGAGRFDVDEAALESIAEKTGGLYFKAEDEKSLSQVFQEINRMETSEVEAYTYREYKERFTPFALIGLVFLILYALLSATLFRRLEV